MQAFVLYDPANGHVERAGIAGPLDWELQKQDGLEILPVDTLPASASYVKSNILKPYPDKAHDGLTFDYENEDWVDLRDEVQIVSDLNVKKNAEIDLINRLSGVIRESFVTDIPAQQMLYMSKETEAASYLTALDPVLDDYPLIAAEVGITAQNAYEVAQVYINKAHILRLTAASLEKIRLGAIKQIEDAQSLDDINTAVETFRGLIGNG